jgi:3-hydroxy-9,10-secoandrosta-1,3,5(10)-triene-9,17-dione monooxygenase
MTHIASGCPATAWVMKIYSGIGRMAEVFPEETMVEIYAESPNARFSGTFPAPGAVLEAVDRGYRIRGRGRWPFSSGCYHADWDLLRVSIEERDGTTADGFCLIPLSELAMTDDWHVMGAAGTGSNSVECGELFIPAGRVSTKVAGVFKLLQVGDAGYAFTAALPLGMARGLSALGALDPPARRGAGHRPATDWRWRDPVLQAGPVPAAAPSSRRAAPSSSPR